jgi:hypothetical protein
MLFCFLSKFCSLQFGSFAHCSSSFSVKMVHWGVFISEGSLKLKTRILEFCNPILSAIYIQQIVYKRIVACRRVLSNCN